MIVSGVDPDRAFTDNDFGLLNRGATTDGKEFVWVQASGALVAQDCVHVDEVGQATATTLSIPGGAARGQIMGVVNVALADNEYGWVQVLGVTTVNVISAGAAAAGVALEVTATSGELDDTATGGVENVERLMLTAAESGGVAPYILTYPTVGATT